MSKKNSTYIVTFLMSMFLVFTNVSAQDSIPKPNVVPPTTVNTETTGEEATTNATESVNYFQESDFLENAPVQKTQKVNAELLAALENNPFALIRDGSPKKTKKKFNPLPVTTAKPSKKSNTTPKQEEKVEIVEPVVVERSISVDTSITALEQQNPFGLRGTIEERQVAFKAKKIKFNPQAGTGAKNSTKPSKPIFDTSKVKVNPLGTLKFVLIIFLLGFLSFIVTRFKNELADVYRAFLNENLLSLLYREKGTILKLPYFLLYVLAACSVGTMSFLIASVNGVEIFKSNFLSILTCIAGVGLLYTTRHLVIALLSYIFPFTTEINLYGFTIAIFNFVIGIALLPFITLMAFASTNTHYLILYIVIGLLAVVYLFRTFRSLMIGNKYLINNKFHFFMYLCTIEIAPMLILIKLAGL